MKKYLPSFTFMLIQKNHTFFHILDNDQFKIYIYIILTHIRCTMEPEPPRGSFVIDQDVKLVMRHLGQLPLTQTHILQGYGRYLQENSQKEDETLLDRLLLANRIAIEKQFISMMHTIFEKIEPRLTRYQKNNSLQYLYPTILQLLNPKIYPKGYRFQKLITTPLSQIREKNDIELTDQLFNELFDIMYELLNTAMTFYEVQNDEQIPEALFESISTFIQANQNCMMVQQDRKSFIALEEEEKTFFEQQDVIMKEMTKLAKNVNQESKSDSSYLGSILGGVYKYTMESSANFVLDKVKGISPFGSSTTSAGNQQKSKLRYSIMSHLRPNLSVRDPVEEVHIEYLMKILPLSLEQIVSSMFIAEREEFMVTVTELLSDFQRQSDVFREQSEGIVREMMSLVQLCTQSGKEPKIKKKKEVKEAKWITLLYKVFEKKYTPERRRILFKFANLPAIKQKIDNSVGMVKFIESQSLNLDNKLLNLIRSLPMAERKDEKYVFNPKKTEEIDLELEHELNRIHLFQMKKKHSSTPYLQFQKLTLSPPKRVVTFVISGFMSKDSCKVDQWGKLVDYTYDSEIYSLRWESKTYADIFDFVVDAGKNIAEANLKVGFLGAIGGPYLRAIAVIRQIYQKYQNNPFNPAFQSAIITGQFLAELIMSSFKGYFVNLVGFSLGTELIKNVLTVLSEKNSLSLVNRVCLMGGVANKVEFEQILKNANTPMSVYNLHSDRDFVLKYMLKACKPKIVPIGLHPIGKIDGHEVVNMDCTDFIEGHLAYRTKLDFVARLLNMKDD